MNMEIEVQPRRILYYPTINIPTGRWLRYALLYWDEIGSIVPYRFDEIGKYLPDVQFMINEGVFRPYRPYNALENENLARSLAHEFFQIISSNDFQTKLPSRQNRSLDQLVYAEKVYGNVYRRLAILGLARREDADLYYFEENTYNLYMSLLAKYICSAQHPFQSTTPGSDQPQYESFVFKTTDENHGIPSFAMQLERVLPVPAENTALDDILRFKRKHKGELDKFVLLTNDLQSSLRDCKSGEQIVDTLQNFQRDLAVQISDLQKALTAARVNFVLGTLGALLTYQHGEIIQEVIDPIMLRLPEFVGGIAVLNCLTKAHELIKSIDSPVAYLLHAQQEFA